MARRGGLFFGLLPFFFLAPFAPSPAGAAVKRYQFDDVSRLCHAKPIVTVNGRFPGPTIYAREGDRVIINVTNHGQVNMSIHWHGLKQFRSGWADGPAYITQCPIMPRPELCLRLHVTGQRGSCGGTPTSSGFEPPSTEPSSSCPSRGMCTLPPTRPGGQHREWWTPTLSGGDAGDSWAGRRTCPTPTPSNGKPGPLFPCSEKHTIRHGGGEGKTYLLRIVNAALNDELFFAIAGHSMTVVEIDAVYCKPFSTDAILIAPGQTTNTAAAILQYRGVPTTVLPSLPSLPAAHDSAFATGYNDKLRSLNSPRFPARVPLAVDRRLFYTIGLGVNLCATCVNGTRLAASLNNITFVMPKVGLLQAHYFNMKGVFRTDFPDRPPKPFNYTGAPLTANLGTSCWLVLQDTNLLTVESHPFHLHGFNFFVVGRGVGNLTPPRTRPSSTSSTLPKGNTVGVPTGGWAAIRSRADNLRVFADALFLSFFRWFSGVWFMHCHLELHTTWGLKMAFVVENGSGPEQSILPPPKDLPTC
ncbi:unnamed protein product [Spirodela intermedia]|uniref:Uncharacterized protein n=1 Tax=Spirodela intermedia TaxID=51605 RepID=A0A7I8J4T0_SPIIN|nr:unnamed protein product [Spirodela intermedia]CAA6665237.1 unnamed protein product [Spirodela intermedia]